MKFGPLSFSVLEYAAWAPGIETKSAWTNWAFHPIFDKTVSEPKLQAMSPMLRRRTDLLGKMALESAWQCLGDQKNIPIVYCSRHGEVARSVGMLTDLAQGELLSPASFSLSVHNAIAGLFSIARSDRVNHIAIASKEDVAESALIEACGLLADGAEKVMVVIYSNALPHQLAVFADREELPYSWAWLIVPPQKEVITLSCVESTEIENPSDTLLPHELEVFRFFLTGMKQLEIRTSRNAWMWRRYHA